MSDNFSNNAILSESQYPTINYPIPTFNLDEYIKTITETINGYLDITNKVNKSINLSLQPLIDNANRLNKSINSSIEPLINSIDSMNKQINSNINKVLSNLALDSLNTLKTISLYTPDIIQSMDKPTFVKTLDEIYDSVETIDFSNNQDNPIKKCKDEIVSIKNQLSFSTLNEIDIHQWIATIATIIGLIISIIVACDKSDKIVIDNQKQIIEYQASQLQKLENIDNSLKMLIESTVQDNQDY